ncbi:MAG: hypothetical protein ACI843_002839 [Psychrobacter glaciei]|jgi:hypothetical protein
MLISGLTEFLIMGSIIYALIAIPANHGYMSTLYRVSLLLTLTASTLGAVIFLSSVDVTAYHQYFTFISKHIALTTFIIGGAWSVYNSRMKRIIAGGLILVALTSLIINIYTELSLLSMILLVTTFAFTGFCMKSNIKSLILLMLAVTALLSTLLSGSMVKDKDLMIGIYHLCVALFYLFITLSYKQINRI